MPIDEQRIVALEQAVLDTSDRINEMIKVMTYQTDIISLLQAHAMGNINGPADAAHVEPAPTPELDESADDR